MADDTGYSAGIDLGTGFAKAAVLHGRDVVSSHVSPMHGTFSAIAEEVLRDALTKADVMFSSLDYIASTGYGEYELPFAHRSVNPLSAGAYGAHSLWPGARTVIDFGMQQSSVMNLDDEGNVVNSVISETCASGSGWILKVIARILGVGIGELGILSLNAVSPVTLTSDCAVFAETEVISRISEGSSREDIVAGVHRDLALRVKGLVDRLGLKKDCVVIGGGSQDVGLMKNISETLGSGVKVTVYPQCESAIGAALFLRGQPDSVQAERTYVRG